jgi:hypothetical protein
VVALARAAAGFDAEGVDTFRMSGRNTTPPRAAT